MLYKLALLFILASLQPGQLQEEQSTSAGVAAVFDEIKDLLRTIKSKTGTHIREFRSFKDQIEGDFRSLKDGLTSLNDSVRSLNDSLQEQLTGQHQELVQLQAFLESSLNDKLEGLNFKLELLNGSISQHEDGTADNLAQLHTSFTNTNLKLDTLTGVTIQLSNDHNLLQANISGLKCVDTEELLQLQQALWNNLTYTKENIQSNVTDTFKPYTCGGTGGWRRVVYLDMTDPNTICPSGWQLTTLPKRTCGKVSTQNLACDSVTFSVRGREYSKVCGRIKAYQYSQTDAFEAYHLSRVTTIDGAYVAGVSVTHGSPRQHIWTFAAGASEVYFTEVDACPCDATITIRVPPFVGNDYFCESARNIPGSPHMFYPDDPLWDGQNCISSSTCCSFNTPPYFVKQLPTSTTDDIETRLCWLDEHFSAIELIELYVQ